MLQEMTPDERIRMLRQLCQSKENLFVGGAHGINNSMPELGLIGFVTVYKLSQGPCKGLVVPLSEVSHVPPYTGWGGGASGGELQQG